MPTYDYQCEAGHQYEKREPFGSPPQQPCEECGEVARRLFSAPPIVFKGSGWYKTESRGKAQPEERDQASEVQKEAAAAKQERDNKSPPASSSSSSSSASSSSSNGSGSSSSSTAGSSSTSKSSSS